jgi:hypothetical protein
MLRPSRPPQRPRAAAAPALPPAAEATPESAQALLFALPYLPPDARLLAAGVCRAWRDALADPCQWLHLDLRAHDDADAEADEEEEDGAPRVSSRWAPRDALLAALAARARGGLLSLRVRGCARVSADAVVAVVLANARLAALRVRCADAHAAWPLLAVRRLLAAAPPALRAFHADVAVSRFIDAQAVIDPPTTTLARLRCRSLRLVPPDDARAAAWPEPSLVALGLCLSAPGAGARVAALHVRRVALTPAGLHALVGAALAARLRGVSLVRAGRARAGAAGTPTARGWGPHPAAARVRPAQPR